MLTPVVVETARGRIEAACVLRTAPGVTRAREDATVLIVHGLPGDWRQARGLVKHLPDHRVVLVSRPGYGRTPISSGRTPAEQADLYAALLDELGIASAVVLGISGGGPSSYAFAARHPDRCAGLLLACAVVQGRIVIPPAMRGLAAVPGVWTTLNAAARLVARLRPPGEPPTSDLTERERSLAADPDVAEALRTFHREQPSTLRGKGMRNDVHQLMRPATGTVTAPTVVLHGDLDEVVPLIHGEHYAAAVTGARLVVLPGLGHAVPLFARAELVSELRSLTGQTWAGPGHSGSGDGAGGATSVS